MVVDTLNFGRSKIAPLIDLLKRHDKLDGLGPFFHRIIVIDRFYQNKATAAQKTHDEPMKLDRHRSLFPTYYGHW